MNTVYFAPTINEKLKESNAMVKPVVKLNTHRANSLATKSLILIKKTVIAVSLIVALIVTALFVVTSHEYYIDLPAIASGEPQSVVVSEGDTVWQIAMDNAPEHIEHREYMMLIQKSNELNGWTIYPGQTLILPQ